MLTINGLVGCATAVFYLINRSVLLKNLINLHRALAAKASVFCMAIFVASGAQAFQVDHVEIKTDSSGYLTGKANIGFSGSKPVHIDSFRRYTITNIALEIDQSVKANQIYKAGTLSDANIELGDLEGELKSQLILDYHLSWFNYPVESYRCFTKYTFHSFIKTMTCLAKVVELTFFGAKHAIDTTDSMEQAVEETLNVYATNKTQDITDLKAHLETWQSRSKETVMALKNNGSRHQRRKLVSDNNDGYCSPSTTHSTYQAEVSCLQNKRIFIDAIEDYVTNISAGDGQYFPETNKDNVLKDLLYLLKDGANDGSTYIDQIYDEYKSPRCDEVLALKINTLTKTINPSKPVNDSDTKQLATNVCKHNPYARNEKSKNAVGELPDDLDKNKKEQKDNPTFRPYVYCGKYTCDFKISPILSYLVLVELMKNKHFSKQIRQAVVIGSRQSIAKNCTIIDGNTPCDIKDKVSLEAGLDRMMNKDAMELVIKRSAYEFITQDDNIALDDNDYRLALVKDENNSDSKVGDNQEILRLANDAHRKLYWPSSQKNENNSSAYYDYNPRVFDSRYIQLLPGGEELIAMFTAIRQEINQQTGEGKSEPVVRLSQEYQGYIECGGKGKTNQCSNREPGHISSINVSQDWVIVNNKKINKDIKKDTGAVNQLKVITKHPPKNSADEYCRDVLYISDYDDVLVPLRKESEADFIKNAKEKYGQDADILCFTVTLQDQNSSNYTQVQNEIDSIYQKLNLVLTESMMKKVDCNALDPTTSLTDYCTINTINNGRHITFFVADKKNNVLNLNKFFKDSKYIGRYSEISPWGRLPSKREVLRESMFENSEIESVQLDMEYTYSYSLLSLFKDAKRIEGAASNIGILDMSKVINMGHMFNGAKKFNNSLRWKTPNVTDMTHMFYGAENFNWTLEWDTSKVTNMSHMFNGASNFNWALVWDTSMVKDMSYMFAGAEKFNNLFKWDTKNVTNMSHMFNGAKDFNRELKGPDGDKPWDTSSVTNMSHMFNDAENFNKPLVLNTSKVTDMSAMFAGATNFDQPLGWNTSEVTNMSFMFNGAENFNKPLGWNTSKVTNMSFMFNGAENFNQNLNWDTSNVEDMSYMFAHAKNFNGFLRKADGSAMSNWNTSNVENMSYMFANAKKFSKNIYGFSIEKAKDHINCMLTGVTQIEKKKDNRTRTLLEKKWQLNAVEVRNIFDCDDPSLK